MQYSRFLLKGVSVCTAVAVLCCVTTGVSAETWYGGDGNWDIDSLWSNGIEPTSSRSATIHTGRVTVNLPGEVAKTLNLADSNSTEEYAQLQVLDGGTLTTWAVDSADHPDSSIEITVDGLGSTWTNTGSLAYLARSGSATLGIRNDGHVDLHEMNTAFYAGSSADINVSGAGSLLDVANTFLIGRLGTGTLDVSDSATLATAGRVVVGDQRDSVGVMKLSGVGTNWTSSAGSLTVGYRGQGSLIIQDGATASGTSCAITTVNEGQGTALVTGAGSTWTLSSIMIVGNSARGTLSVTDGGTLVSASGLIGYSGADEADPSLVTVSGAGSTWTMAGDLVVGQSGNAEMLIEAGGAVTSGDAFISSVFAKKTLVSVIGAGSSWHVMGNLRIAERERDATLKIANGGHVYFNPG